jgi:murein DD-endopeptidase MepM/ murein hydrolase activator NlpD
MSPENVRERKEPHRYTFVIVPDAKSEKTRTLSVTKWGFFSTVISVLIVMVATIFAVVIYTPVGRYLPISNPELTKRYGKEILDIQNQLQRLVKEVTVMRGYNLRLRKVLGEKISTEDSARMIAGGVDTSAVTSKFWLDSRDTGEENTGEAGQTTTVQKTEQGTLTSSQIVQGRETDFISKLPLTKPVSGFETEGFDPAQFHYGIDLAGKQGSPILAAADGNVVFSGWTYDDGFMIIIMHELGYVTVYKHNASLVKNIGDVVKRGEIIALLGNTGEKSRGAHLHFEVWKNGIVQDPNNYLLSVN